MDLWLKLGSTVWHKLLVPRGYTGDVGTSFEAANDLVVTAFGRMPRDIELDVLLMVRLWDDDDQALIKEHAVGPAAYLKGDYRYEDLDEPIKLVKGKRYTISQRCDARDEWVEPNTDSWAMNAAIGLKTEYRCTYPLGDGYPAWGEPNTLLPIVGFLASEL